MQLVDRVTGRLGFGWGRKATKHSKCDYSARTLQVTLRGGNPEVQTIVITFHGVKDEAEAAIVSHSLSKWAQSLNKMRVNRLLRIPSSRQPGETIETTRRFAFDVNPKLISLVRDRQIDGVQLMVGIFTDVPLEELEVATRFYRMTASDKLGYVDNRCDVISGASIMAGNPLLRRMFSEVPEDTIDSKRHWSYLAFGASRYMSSNSLGDKEIELIAAWDYRNSKLMLGDSKVASLSFDTMMDVFQERPNTYPTHPAIHSYAFGSTIAHQITKLAAVPREILEKHNYHELRVMLDMMATKAYLGDEADLLCRYFEVHPIELYSRYANDDYEPDPILRTLLKGDNGSVFYRRPVLISTLHRMNVELNSKGLDIKQSFLKDIVTCDWLSQPGDMELPLFLLEEAGIVLNNHDLLKFIAFLSERPMKNPLSITRKVISAVHDDGSNLPFDWLLLNLG